MRTRSAQSGRPAPRRRQRGAAQRPARRTSATPARRAPPPAPQDVFEDDENLHLVMELCEGGGILDRMKAGMFTEARIAGIIRGVLRFIAQCHARGLIYRDVKPDNFLFLTPHADSPVRATDFGLSIRRAPGLPPRSCPCAATHTVQSAALRSARAARRRPARREGRR
jgi:serine/threonine protein kinase